MDPIISIITPVYNPKEEYLIQCVESLVHQTYRNIEIILIDDGSAEKIAELCDRYRDQFPSVTVIHKKNEGVAVARNTGITQSHGEYILFVDADDWLEPDCIEKVLPKIIETGVDFLYFHHNIAVGHKRHPKGGTELASGPISREQIRELQQNMIKGNSSPYPFSPLTPWGELIRREALQYSDTIFPAGLKRSQDIIFNLFVTEHIKSAYSFPCIGYNYRVHSDSSVNRLRPDISDIFVRLLNEMEKFVDAYHRDDLEYLQKIGYRAIKQLYYIEGHYTLHPDSKLNWKQILAYSRSYINDPLVKKYIKFSTLKDFQKPIDIFFYFIVKYRLFGLYYLYCMFFRKPWLQHRYEQRAVS